MTQHFLKIAFACLILFSCSKNTKRQVSNTTTKTHSSTANVVPAPPVSITRDESKPKEDVEKETGPVTEEQAPTAIMEEVMITGYGTVKKSDLTGSVISRKGNKQPSNYSAETFNIKQEEYNTESYAFISENDFLASKEHPLSTFSIDVDGASYSNTRRYINENGSLPPQDAVRIEEFVNYFQYDYPQPQGDHPFSITTEAAECPWNKNHQLVHIGLQGKNVPFEKIAPMNLVFLIDVSGSMEDANKLPLLKKSFRMLVSKLRDQDRIAITVYAGAAGLVLPSTSGNNKDKINDAIDNLSAGGSTAGGEGIKLAYKVADDNFIKDGINRVIIATDGDFNVGVSSDAEMTRLVEKQRESGVFLTALGFGQGNYKDSKMESIADHGNGNYFYIDNIQEGEKVLVTELDGTLCTIAKDVKLQVEFNPAKVKAYRLIGYENRKLNKEDFNDDKKDAGELGAGHTVTALYEIIPAGSKEEINGVDALKYQQVESSVRANTSSEMLTVKFRYKDPAGSVSKLIVQALNDKTLSLEKSSGDFRFSAAVAGYGMLLRDSKFKGDFTYNEVISMAVNAKGKDQEGYRSEFVRMVKTTQLLSKMASK